MSEIHAPWLAALLAERERLREALVEERAARLWYRWVAEIGYGLSGEWEDGDDPRLLPEHRTRERFRDQAWHERAEDAARRGAAGEGEAE